MKRAAQLVRRFAFEEWGGTENVVWNSSLHLLPHDFVSEILATRACSASGDEVRDGIQIRRFPYFYPYFPLNSEKKLALDKKGGNPFCFGLRRALLEENFALYHVHAGGRIAQFAREAALQRKKPYLLSFHGGCFDVPASEMTKMLSPLRHTFPYGGIADRIFGWKADVIADASAILCVGANEVPEFQKRYPDKRVEYLPNGVDPEVFRRKSSLNLREELHIPSDRRIVLCVSRIDYQKNQKQLLKVADAARSRGEKLHLLMIGPPTAPGYYAELLADAKSMGLDSFLTVIPGLPPAGELMLAAYQQSDVFVLPSVHEPFGIVVLEAWSAGIPVIASSVGGLRFLVEDGKNGLMCPPDDTGAYLAALERLKEDSFRSSLIDGASRAVETYSWSRIAARLANLYEELIRSC